MQAASEQQLADLGERDGRRRVEGVLAVLLAELEEQDGGRLDDDEDHERAQLLRVDGEL